ncbi:hypothetical protein GCM10027613_31620 [Microlunatus endophyticus]
MRDDETRLTRRRLLAVAAGTAGGLTIAAGSVGYRIGTHDSGGASTDAGSASATTTPTSTASTTTETSGSGAGRFRSRPDLQPPPVQVTHLFGSDRSPEPDSNATSPQQTGTTSAPQLAPYYFLTPKAYTPSAPINYQVGPMIIEPTGHVVWFQPSAQPIQKRAMDLRVQTYRGQPVLTWYEGKSANGYGKGTAKIVDSHYTTVATIKAVGGLKVDLHEFRITSRDTALITAYRTSTTDLTAIRGLRRGTIVSGVVQEIDIATGRLIFSWDSLDHVSPEMTYKKASADPTTQLDYFHINSIDEIDEHTLLISSRNTCAVYKIDKRTGKIIWQLGGKKSDFEHQVGTRFYYQHSASMVGVDEVLLFDNGGSPAMEPQSRALRLKINTDAHTVTMVRSLTHPAKLLSVTMGNVNQLTNGHYVVGWGSEPYFSEYAADGSLLLDAKMPNNIQSYRAFGADWIGNPTDKPALAVGTNAAGGATVYISWNGATRVATWRVRAGGTKAGLKHHATAARQGFETAVAVNSTGPYFQALAVDKNGHELGRSEIVKATV